MPNEIRVTSRPDAEPPRDQSSSTTAPDGGYGWVVTVSVGFINGHSWGISAAYSVFLAHYLKESTFPGATALMYATVGSLSIGVTLLISPLVTIMARELGTRPTMLIGAGLQSASLVCASFSTEIWHLFLSQGVLFGIGMGLLFLPSYGIISQWFTKRRALANGIAIAGAGLGGLTYSLAVGAMIKNMSLEWAYRLLGIVSGVVNFTSTLLIRTRYGPTQSRQLAFDTSLLRKPEYLLILGFGAFSMLGYFVLIFTLANYATVIGLSTSQASMVAALFMLGQAIGRPGIGWLSDRFGRINITLLMSFATAVSSLAIWVNAKSFGVLVLFAFVGGLSAGVFWVNTAPVIVEIMGMENLTSGLSIFWLAMVIPSTFSEPIALEISERTGSYLGAQLFTGFMFVGASLCMLVLRGWQVSQGTRTDEGNSTSSEGNENKAESGHPTAWALNCIRCGRV
ncbi:hypothetical protein QQX98_002619 [Neonectria punicea]|uniref:Major facilitator superfamily (MFS) profile domain-containing protein n=1 Tax=Neonectria punicea TaxID=979145 RepID=A0ABR1HIT6_9HYPO